MKKEKEEEAKRLKAKVEEANKMLQATKDSSLHFYDWQVLGHPCILAFEDMLPLSEEDTTS
eukprot:11233730-Prorocentrum_lima.AAC.1